LFSFCGVRYRRRRCRQRARPLEVVSRALPLRALLISIDPRINGASAERAKRCTGAPVKGMRLELAGDAPEAADGGWALVPEAARAPLAGSAVAPPRSAARSASRSARSRSRSLWGAPGSVTFSVESWWLFSTEQVARHCCTMPLGSKKELGAVL